MKKNIILAYLSITLLSYTSCSENDGVERLSTEPTMVKTELMTSMPGELLVVEDRLVWFDLNADSFLHVENATTGENILETGMLGGGPEDFTAPFISWYPNKRVLISDCFAERAMVLLLEKTGKMSHLDIPFSKKTLQCVGENQYIQSNIDGNQPFIYWNNNTKDTFGKYPLEDEEISNANEVFQGIHSYNPYNGYLIQSFPELSHIALYQFIEGKFKEVWTKELPGLEYQINRDRILRINEVRNPAPSAIALTKDYIVTIDRDKQTKETVAESHSNNRFLRNFSKSPQTLFVYDYNFQLKRIIHTHIPMFRLAARGDDNVVYFMGVKDEFCIAKCRLD